MSIRKKPKLDKLLLKEAIQELDSFFDGPSKSFQHSNKPLDSKENQVFHIYETVKSMFIAKRHVDHLEKFKITLNHGMFNEAMEKVKVVGYLVWELKSDSIDFIDIYVQLRRIMIELWFNARKPDGKIWSLEELEKEIDHGYSQVDFGQMNDLYKEAVALERENLIAKCDSQSLNLPKFSVYRQIIDYLKPIYLEAKKLVESPYSTPKKTGGWQNGLAEYIKNPTKGIEWRKEWVMIFDKYPKAKHHLLLIPRLYKDDGELDLDYLAVSMLTFQHLPMLYQLEAVCKEYAEKYDNLKVGFHAIPSMENLHIHLISLDFDSACVKTKRHYLSFTTDFFVPLSLVISRLEKNMSPLDPNVNYEQLLRGSLVCHRCRGVLPNMPKLKSHLLQCEINL